MIRSRPGDWTRIQIRRSGRRWLALVLLAVGLGCSTMGSFEPMEVTLTDLDVTEVTIFETRLVAKLRITNPNPDAITIDGASFKLFIEDKKVGIGTTKESFALDRLDSSVIDVDFLINNASALLRIKEILEDNDVNYGVRGALFTEGTFGTRKIKIEKTGRLDLSGVNSREINAPSDEASPPSS